MPSVSVSRTFALTTMALHDRQSGMQPVAAHRHGVRPGGIGIRLDGAGGEVERPVVPSREAGAGEADERIRRQQLRAELHLLREQQLPVADDVRHPGIRIRRRVVEALNPLRQRLGAALGHPTVVDDDGAQRRRRVLVPVDQDEAGADGARPGHAGRVIGVVVEDVDPAGIRHLHDVRAIGDVLARERIDRQEAQHIGAIGDQPAPRVPPVAPARLGAGLPVERLGNRPGVQPGARRVQGVPLERRADHAGVFSLTLAYCGLDVEVGGKDLGPGRNAADDDVLGGDAVDALAEEARPADHDVTSHEVGVEVRQRPVRALRADRGGRLNQGRCDESYRQCSLHRSHPISEANPGQGPRRPGGRRNVRPASLTGSASAAIRFSTG